MAEQNIFYDETTRGRMIAFAARLPERDLRAYAAVEAYKLGRGGVGFISDLLSISTETIKRGQRELDDPELLPSGSRQRHPGAGRIGVLAEQPGLDEAFDAIVEDRRAGDPMNPDVTWTDLLPREIAERLGERGFHISETTARALLKTKNFVGVSR